MEHEVPRTRSGIGLGEWRVVGSERAFSAVKFVDQRLIKAKIVHDGEAIVGR